MAFYEQQMTKLPHTNTPVSMQPESITRCVFNVPQRVVGRNLASSMFGYALQVHALHEHTAVCCYGPQASLAAKCITM